MPKVSVAKFNRGESLKSFQDLIRLIYRIQDDRFFSVQDLLSNQQRFTMRALKGIRKNDKEKLKKNLLICFSWSMAVANRMHFDLESELWQRFPGVCSYCRQAPCVCAVTKLQNRKTGRSKSRNVPRSLEQYQKMFNEIYPFSKRTLTHAGVHLAEEMGEVAESILGYLGEHKTKQFRSLKEELADFASCVFGVANSGRINLAKELAIMFKRNCHDCHQLPCICDFSKMYNYQS